MTFDVDAKTAGGRGVRPYLWPVLTATIALVVGATAGGVVGWAVKPPVVETKVVPRELTEAELEQIWAPKVAAVEQDLGEARDLVQVLEDEVKTKQARVEELEAQMARRSAKGAELARELEAARTELAVVKQQLAQALAEKEQLATELKVTVAKLDEQKQKTREAKDETIDQKWRGFVRQAQLDVCEKGTRKKMGGCRETVAAILDTDMQAKFTHCLRAGQEAPSLREAAKDETLPQFAEYLDQDDKVTRDWYVLLCDPSLPEADQFADTQPVTTADASPIE